MNTPDDSQQVNRIQQFYKWHANIYEATRWAFLFGRKRLVEALNLPFSSQKNIVEVGCGTGHNLYYLAKNFPALQLTGIDISTDMLQVANKKVKRFLPRISFINMPYFTGADPLPVKPNIVIFSYCLTMINPGWEDALHRAYNDLGEGDLIAVVDFHHTPLSLFRRWMDYNHVRMDEHLLPALSKQFKPVHLEIRQAYGGLWTYFLFVGKK